MSLDHFEETSTLSHFHSLILALYKLRPPDISWDITKKRIINILHNTQYLLANASDDRFFNQLIGDI